MSEKWSLTRRRFLKSLAVGAGAVALTPVGNALGASSVPFSAVPRARRADVTIKTSGWPISVITDDEAASDPVQAAQKAAIEAWLENNPGVELKQVDINIWDGNAMLANIAGGTDCSFIFAASMGNWSLEGARNVFVQGLVADVSEVVTATGLEGRVLPHVWPGWAANSAVGGKFWSYPLNEYTPDGSTMLYRKDLINELGLKEPEIGWTWDEAAALFKGLTDSSAGRYGAVFASWMMAFRNENYGSDILTRIPRPDQNWHWDLDYSDPRWVQLIEEYRRMLFEDQSILTDIALGDSDDDLVKLFLDGTAAVARVGFFGMVGPATQADTPAAMAKNAGKEFSEMFGFVLQPTGDGYQRGGGVNIWGPVSFSVNDDSDTHLKAAELIDWMFFGQGLDMTKAAAWEATKDPQSVFSAFLYMDGRQGYEGVPATPADAWGEEFVARWTAVGELPFEPVRNDFFPPEEEIGPDSTALDDKYSLFVTTQGEIDVAGQLGEGVQNWRDQASGFRSSISEDDFRAGAQQYYAALDAFFKEHYPAFYENRFKPYLDDKVTPHIS